MAQSPPRLKRRREFLRVAGKGNRGARPGLVLQALPSTGAPLRVGFTATKKLGNAVVRNRAKRRLRALAREVMPGLARPGWDYVLVGRPGATVERGFADLRADLAAALARVHGA